MKDRDRARDRARDRDRSRGAERIRRYLRDRPEGATSEEIARDVLHLAATAPKAQEKIVEALLREEAGVERGGEGRWFLAAGDSGAAEASYVAAAVRTSRETGDVIAIGLRRMAEAPDLLDLDRETDTDWEGAPERVAGFLESSILVTFDQQKTARTIGRFTESVPGAERPAVLSVQRLGKRLLGLKRHPSLHELCDRLAVTQNVEGALAAEVETLAEVFEKLRHEAAERGLEAPEDLLGVQERRPIPVDFSRFSFTPAYLASLPPRPGVYVMRDREGKIIYVGKTKNLASRVRSYFRSVEDRPAKISRILEQLYDLRCVPVGSDLEAILVEARLIRSEEPEVNVQRKVHPRPGRKRAERNIVIVTLSAEPDSAELFILAEGWPLRQVRIRRDLKDLSAAREALGEACYGSPPAAPLLPEEEEDLRLAWSYFRRHRDSLHWVNADHAGGKRDLLARVKEKVRELGE